MVALAAPRVDNDLKHPDQSWCKLTLNSGNRARSHGMLIIPYRRPLLDSVVLCHRGSDEPAVDRIDNWIDVPCSRSRVLHSNLVPGIDIGSPLHIPGVRAMRRLRHVG